MKEITGPELRAMAERGDRPLLVVDVREPWEVAVASLRIDGIETRCIPMNEIPGRLATLDPAQPTVCVCHHGARSAHVVAFLDRNGFTDAWNLAGGIDAWSAEVDPGVPRY